MADPCVGRVVYDRPNDAVYMSNMMVAVMQEDGRKLRELRAVLRALIREAKAAEADSVHITELEKLL